MTQAFAGVRIIDFSQVFSGPFATMQLGLLLDTSLALLAPLISNYLNIGAVPELVGNGSVVKLPSTGTFATEGGGAFLLSAITNKQWAGIAKAIERPDLATDPRFQTVDGRRDHYDYLRPELQAVFATNSALHWEGRLNAEGVPASAIRSIPEIMEHPQVAHRGAIDRVSSAAGVDRDIRLVRSGFTADADGPEINSPPPGKGEHTDAILLEAGYSEQDIAMLRNDGVL